MIRNMPPNGSQRPKLLGPLCVVDGWSTHPIKGEAGGTRLGKGTFLDRKHSSSHHASIHFKPESSSIKSTRRSGKDIARCRFKKASNVLIYPLQAYLASRKCTSVFYPSRIIILRYVGEGKCPTLKPFLSFFNVLLQKIPRCLCCYFLSTPHSWSHGRFLLFFYAVSAVILISRLEILRLSPTFDGKTTRHFSEIDRPLSTNKIVFTDAILDQLSEMIL